MILTFAPKASLFGGDVKIGCLHKYGQNKCINHYI